jgi:signal transduction histidine kinase
MEASARQAQWEDLAIRDTPQSAEQIQASYLTHELRAPITSIRLGLEIFQEQVEGRLQGDEKHMLSLAVRNTARLEGLVNDIMDHAKIMAGKMQIERRPCDAWQLVGEAMDSLQALALAKGVKLSKQWEGPLPRVHADARRIVQILTNLLSNAIKFTPARGTVTVCVKEGRFEHAGTLVFRVKDTGCGIAAKDIDKVFDVFAQAGSSVKQSEGTGLGLTLAKSMVSLHGGRIWAESWRELGSSFHFTVPIAREDLSAAVEVYPKPLEYHGLLVALARRMNAILAMFV